MSFKLSCDKLKSCHMVLGKLTKNYREKDSMSAASSGGSDKIGDKLDDTELLATFIDALRKVIENFPNYGLNPRIMSKNNIEYFIYEVDMIHIILEEALKPVFHIDRQEKKKQKRKAKLKMKGAAAEEEQEEDNSQNGMSSDGEQEEFE